ncbi:hypothetical protein HanIR_Chr02g0082281 [Helianthus annuus]|nr:hypothetical protein HanIR_Chr02g0082281 [Helianthus annuus]
MASPSIPSSPPLSSVEEDVENVDAGGALPVLKWPVGSFRQLMLTVRMPDEYGARYPKGGDTATDAPAGFVTLFFDFFGHGNFRLLLTVFMADLLEYYRIHISQLSPLGMVRAHHFEYCFKSQDLEPAVERFRRFYKLQVQLSFYSFQLHMGAFKILEQPPKGFTQWKSKFFYVKEAAVACKQYFQSVFVNIPKEKFDHSHFGSAGMVSGAPGSFVDSIDQQGFVVSLYDVAVETGQ